ncbi:MAG: hypothetical protein JXR69_01180 [Candidatus Delongbacteria bacterium]|nr:hypothetical protein [Candidatus Delongbacteria bacterium]
MIPRLVYLFFVLILNSVLLSSQIDELINRGNELYFNGDIEKALYKFYEAEKLNPFDLRPKEGIYNSCIYLGKYKTANKYAKKLFSQSASDINTDRVIYTDALLGKTNEADKLLDSDQSYERKKYLLSLTGWGLYNSGHYIEALKWFEKVRNHGFRSSDFSDGYSLSRDKLRSERKVADISISPFIFNGSQNFDGGLNLNYNFNYGKYDKRYDLDLVMQYTVMDPSRVSENPNFYGDIGQYEIFWSYERLNSSTNSFYNAGKLSFITNDYVKFSLTGLSGLKYRVNDQWLFDSYLSGSIIGYAYYDILDVSIFTGKQPPPPRANFNEYYNTLFSMQSTTNATYYTDYFYINGEISLIKLLNSSYFSDMRIYDDRDDLPDEVVDSDIIEYFYTVRAGITTRNLDIFGSFSEGNNFLLNSDGGRFLNTTEFGYENGFSGGITFNKLFHKWVVSYIFSQSNYEDYNIITNTLVASYSW